MSLCPLRTLSQITLALWVSQMQAPLAFKARCFGSHFSGTDLKSWGFQTWGSNPSLLRAQVGILSYLQIVGCHTGGKVYSEIMSPFLLPVLM